MYNPVAGAGRSAAAAASAAEALMRHGHDVSTIASRLEPTRGWLDAALEGAGLLVVAGGDGAMRLSAPSACRTRTPVYHLPLGTENLFAREFGMNRRDDTLLRAIDAQRVRTVDIALANNRWFLLMASVGFDAEVVHTLAATRGGKISHLTYIKPILATMRTWTPPRLTVEVDGERLVTERPGIVVIANCRQYGWRIDPVARADMSDGLLDMAFLPAQSLRNVVGWVVRCRLRRQYRHDRFICARGRSVVVHSDDANHFQLDGDPPGIVHELLPDGYEAAGLAETEDQAAGPLALRIQIVPGLLSVLTAGDGP